MPEKKDHYLSFFKRSAPRDHTQRFFNLAAERQFGIFLGFVQRLCALNEDGLL